MTLDTATVGAAPAPVPATPRRERRGTWPAARAAAFLLAAALAALAAGPDTPAAQEQELRNPLPEGMLIDPETDPAPFDPLLEIRKHLTSRIATHWWINNPERTTDAYFVRVHLPVDWRGNPVSATMALCPEPGDPLWKHIRLLYLQPFHQHQSWPTITCWP